MKKKLSLLIAIFLILILSLNANGSNSTNLKNGIDGPIIIITPPVKIIN